MTEQEIERFEKVVGGLKAELVSLLYGRRDRLLISQSADPLDQTRDLSELDLDSQQISLLTTKLRNLETALGKIHEGTFGLCDGCEREIPLRRLEAVPWSAFCVACQEAAEARAGELDDTESEDGDLPVRASLPVAKKGRSVPITQPTGGAARREPRQVQPESPPRMAARSVAGVALPRNRTPKSGYNLSAATLSRRPSTRTSSPPPA